MKKNLVLISCLGLLLFLGGCSNNSYIQSTNESQTSQDNSKYINAPTEAANDQISVDEKKETDSNTTSSTESTKKSPDEQKVEDKNNNSNKTPKVNSKVKLYNGAYFDDRRFGDNILKNYCEVVISNVTNTSFDFTVYEVNALDGKTESKKFIFLKNTAVFIGDGTKVFFTGRIILSTLHFPISIMHTLL